MWLKRGKIAIISISNLMISSLPKSLLSQYRQPLKISQKFPKTLSLVAKMAPWTCSKCTFINPSAQSTRCDVCLSAPPLPLPLPLAVSSPAPPPPPKSAWSCAACTFLNPCSSAICEICGTRAAAIRLLTVEIDDDDGGGFDDKSKFVNNGGRQVWGDGGEMGFSAGLRPCSKRKQREGYDGGDGSSSSAFAGVEPSNKAVVAKPLGETHLCSESKTWKFLSYNVWFREDLEMHLRMRAIGNLIELHSPDVICFQEVTPSFYEIFRISNWWKEYQCSIPNERAFPGGYFCMQLSRLPVKSFTSKPFHNSIMGRELSVAEVELLPGTTMAVATSHLESPSPGPPTWNQFYSKERVAQANEAVRSLERNENVIFCGDMNWDDKLDGPFPLPRGWVDAWAELRPGEDGWTYDTKSNKMLTGNRSLQKRLDRFVCKLKGMEMSSIEMIGRDAIVGASYIKEKRVKGQVKELCLPVLPSDHYGLLLTTCSS